MVMNRELDFLVVEDDPIDVKAINFLLLHTELARHIDNCSTLKQAISKVQSCHFDAVIFDLSLPDCQGVDGLIEFKAMAPDLPIIVLTGIQNEETALRSLNIGAEDVIDKNFIVPEQFSRALLFAIKRHSHLRRAYHDKVQLGRSLKDAMSYLGYENYPE
jgi:DNA-binding NarL/FixJ family response regulator